MEIHQDNLSDIDRYILKRQNIRLESKHRDFEMIMKRIAAFKDIHPNAEFLELGIGTGWFLILCKKKGISCKGIEISPQLVEFAHQFGRQNDVEPDIELGNIEEADIGRSRYDVIIASSTFEHVERWRTGLEKVYAALKPGGLFYFESSNKFSLKSAEYKFPLYGWLPNSWRYRLRIARQGEDIMKLGIDFNQFTYFKLRRFFKQLGYGSIYDRLQIFCLSNATNPSRKKKTVMKFINRIEPLRQLALLFASTTVFICLKPASSTLSRSAAENPGDPVDNTLAD